MKLHSYKFLKNITRPEELLEALALPAAGAELLIVKSKYMSMDAEYYKEQSNASTFQLKQGS